MNKKIIIIVCIFIIAICTCLGVKYLLDVKRYQEKVSKIEIKDVNLNSISDGEYTGKCDVDFIKAEVIVEVKDNKISNIKLVEHKNGRGKKAEGIINEVKAKNSLKVDTVTGATNSSKVILKAIEVALEG